MGKHFWWGCGLLSLLLIFSLVISGITQRRQRPLWEALEEAQTLAEQDPRHANRLLEETKSRWDRYAGGMAAISDHEPMDQVEEVFAEAALFGKAGDTTHFSTACARLAQLLRALSEDHRLTLRNLF